MLLVITVYLCLAAATVARAHGRVPKRVDAAIHAASRRYGAPYLEMVAVSWCESRWFPGAVGDGSYGLFQFLKGTWARTPYARFSVFNPEANALAAAWLWRADGGSWREWTCQP